MTSTGLLCCVVFCRERVSLGQEVMARAQIIILHGHQLSAGHHYATALIMQRCNELRHRCDRLDAALKAKHSYLLQTHQLLLSLGQVLTSVAALSQNITGRVPSFTGVLHVQALTWCDDGAYLLANQLVDKSQCKEGAQASLKDIDRFLEGAPSILRSRSDILTIEYERVLTPQLQVSQGTFHTGLMCIFLELAAP